MTNPKEMNMKTTTRSLCLFQVRSELVLFSILIGLMSCQSHSGTSIPSPHVIPCMDDFQLSFNPQMNADSLLASDGWLRLDQGRLVVKTFAIPKYDLPPEVQLNVTLRSKGDPWDKSGAVLLLPANDHLNLLDLELGRLPEEEGKQNPGTVSDSLPQGAYEAPLELMRFITPFGVGHFSQMERLDEYRPVYIPSWEDSVHWEADVSNLWTMMKDSITIGVYIDTWSAEGQELDMTLSFEPKPAWSDPYVPWKVASLVNTTKFGSKQNTFDRFSSEPLQIAWDFDEDAYDVKLHYLVTGHGGHSTGDEFTPCEHILSWNDSIFHRFTPWRDDCASFRRFNPSSGVWTERTYWKGDSIDERIASSDYSRSGWCPGSQVEPVVISLGKLEAGAHELTIDIPTAQSYTDDEMNFWNIGAYLTWSED